MPVGTEQGQLFDLRVQGASDPPLRRVRRKITIFSCQCCASFSFSSILSSTIVIIIAPTLSIVKSHLSKVNANLEHFVENLEFFLRFVPAILPLGTIVTILKQRSGRREALWISQSNQNQSRILPRPGIPCAAIT